MANTTSTNLKLTVQATGENSGTWGQITNTNLLILEQAIGGYDAVGLNATTGATLTFSNGVLSNGKNQVLKLTGTITSNVDVVIPDSIEKTYIMKMQLAVHLQLHLNLLLGRVLLGLQQIKGIKYYIQMELILLMLCQI